ncbi:hypothetical protein AAH061_06895, partial [Parabacteroides distasonis]
NLFLVNRLFGAGVPVTTGHKRSCPVQARSSPPGVVEKSSSPGGLAVFFPPTLHVRDTGYLCL